MSKTHPKLGYVILYVPDVAAAVAFYERAFGLIRSYVHESGGFAAMNTGATALAFAAEGTVEGMGVGFQPLRPETRPGGFEVALVVEDVAEALAQAVEAGAALVKPVEMMPWGQTVAYVRDLNGALVELCTHM